MITCEFEDGGKVSLRHAVVDSLVLKDDKILLVKRVNKLLEGGKWALVGGYVDRDETLAEAAAREVFKETGWRVKDVTLFRINDDPNRPGEDRQNVAFVFFCTATEKTGEPDWESDAQTWFDWSDLPSAESLAFDHGESIKLYRQYLEAPFALPGLG